MIKKEMKTNVILRLALTFIFAMLVRTSFAQTNDTDYRYYHWRAMQTTPQKGYYVLKSGKAMVGQIFLKGSPDHIESFWYLDDLREIEIPHGSITCYGLSGFPGSKFGGTSTVPVLDCDDALLPLGLKSSKEGSVYIQQTKPKNGYVIPHGGNKITGELTVVYHNDLVWEFILKNSSGTVTYPMQEIAHYGLVLTIDILTNGGKKKYNDEGRNFFPGSVEMVDGTVQNGFLAFYKTGHIDGDMRYGKYYSGLMFTPTREGTIERLEDNEIRKVTQDINGVQTPYGKFNQGFVSSSALTDLPFKDETRKLHPGEITLDDGTILKGELLLQRQELNWFYYAILFKDLEGNLSSYSPMFVSSVTQTIDGKTTKYISYQGSFIELMYEGKNFQLYRNPFPTTVNKFLTTLSKATTNVAAGITQNVLIEKSMPEGASKEDITHRCEEVRGQMGSMSIEQLQAFMKECSDAKGPVGSPQYKLMDQYRGIVAAELIARASESTEINKKEWEFRNMNTGEETIVTQGGYKDQVEPLLASCENYLMMDKKEQNQINNFDAIEQAVKLLDACYEK